MRLAAAAMVVPAFFQTCLPNPPEPEPEPPVAHIEFECLTDDCLLMELSAENSVGADAYEWSIDGVDYGTDAFFAIDVPGRALMEVVVTVTNDAGTDTAVRYIMTTPVYEDPSDPGVGFDPSTALVIVGAQGCDSNAVISTVGGCFNGPNALDQVVERNSFGLVNRSVLTYAPDANTLITPGFAVAARWRNNHNPAQYSSHSSTTFYFNSVAADYTNGTYLNLHGNGTTNHITSYYPLPTGTIMDFEFEHGAYLGDPGLQPLDALRLDCSGGDMVVSALPLFDLTDP